MGQSYFGEFVQNSVYFQFIQLLRIWSQKLDYLVNSEILYKKFIERSFHEKELKRTIKQVAKMDKSELLRDRTEETKTHKRY